METSFVTAIAWEAQRQDVLFSLNTGELQIVEKSQTDWRDSICRSMFLASQAASMDVGGDVVATGDAQTAGIKSFVAVPILNCATSEKSHNGSSIESLPHPCSTRLG
ncbi:hypothetical protein [Rhodanobacter sp. T12-5]|uniref:hypothetical protein n=1 Tax=Rhodanobacter sp. T12-5 TaxID=2024611 RepID=UPI0011EFF36F|nr:hypothetical protein [Rhodanobacter sp. T12-5]KAA0069798.1 hypothetical protein CIW53_10900 [Rhodanobacter sp. T12-5]